MKCSLRASSPIWATLARTREQGTPRGFAAPSRVLARLALLAQTGELARRLHEMALYLQLYLGLPPPEPLDLRGRNVSENWRKFKQKYTKLRNCNWHKHEVKCQQNSYAAKSHWQRCH